MINCPKCSKDNQDHYKFCLGCGAELPRGGAPKPFSPETPPHGMRAAAPPQPAANPLGGTVGIAPPAAAPVAPRPPSATAATVQAPSAHPPAVGGGASVSAKAGTTVLCPQCSHVNAPTNLFCGSCGFRMGVAPPRPAAAAPLQVAATEAAASALTLTALRADGTEAGTYQVPPTGGVIGRESGSIFAGDSYLSPRHASLRLAGPGRAGIKDEGSLNGVYKRLARDVPTELKPNEMFRIGQEIMKYEPLATQPPSPDGVERLGAPSKGYVGRIALVIGREETGNAFPIPESGVHLGRERGDVVFPEDGYVSGLHCRLSWDGRKLFLTDLGSSNGTFLRVADAELRSGDVLLMGQQLFRVSV